MCALGYVQEYILCSKNTGDRTSWGLCRVSVRLRNSWHVSFSVVALFISVTLFSIPQSVQLDLIIENGTDVIIALKTLISFKDVFLVWIILKILVHGSESHR